MGAFLERGAAMVLEGRRLPIGATPFKDEGLAAHRACMALPFPDKEQSAAQKQEKQRQTPGQVCVARLMLAMTAQKQTPRAAEAVEQMAAGENGETENQAVGGLSTLPKLHEATEVLSEYAIDQE